MKQIIRRLQNCRIQLLVAVIYCKLKQSEYWVHKLCSKKLTKCRQYDEYTQLISNRFNKVYPTTGHPKYYGVWMCGLQNWM